MIFGFISIIAAGTLPTLLLVFCLQLLIFKELISISTVANKERHLPWMRALNWYFLLITTNALYGKVFYKYAMRIRIEFLTEIIQFCTINHRFVNFALYVFGFVWFVASLRPNYYKYQFTQFSWTLMLLFFVVYQSHFMVDSILEGLFWFLIPVSFVIVNDIFAYIFGFFFGRHSLTRLSPKKTWEGFIGGAISTVVFAFMSLRSNIFNYAVCTPSSVFVQRDYILPVLAVNILKHFGYNISKVTLLPVQLHSIFLAMFASLIAPFGGFFASGVKRAFKIKDFGNTIPGHGGVTDRFDCQFIMAFFSYVYYSTFIKGTTISITSIMAVIVSKMTHQDQIQLYHSLGNHLSAIDSTSILTSSFEAVKTKLLHSIFLAMFASLIAPFGGFFASGVKRAFKIKDFGNTIPGHGGVTDRFDCQFIMAFFSYVYYSTFIKGTTISITSIMAVIVSKMTHQDQIQLYHSLGNHLSAIDSTSILTSSFEAIKTKLV
ncbi:putative phosphatidate cytidylyltransferase [Smittium culicis]|uniref:Phosphatidate cytidylyltransferase n=1 Tax=Smittium culicis TaxID=133412 RepID=A0A1R1YNB2_9FUNG|nr:putative phosphatidate cytidylyltransferase [Smittium culicis]